MGREKGSSNRASALTQQWEISAFSMKAAEQDEGLVLDTAEAAAFRLSAETLFFPSLKQQMSCRSSCLQPASPHYSAQLGTGNKASTKHPHPRTSAKAPWTEGYRRLESPSTHPTVTPLSCGLEDVL